MSIPLPVNGITFNYPDNNDDNWGDDATNWASAVTSGMLQKAGGIFTLTADVDFGANFGLQSAYYKSQSTPLASSGAIRLARADEINWRNNGDNANLELTVNASDQLTFNGSVLATGSGGDVVGPGSATDNALVRFDTTSGKIIQNSTGVLDDSGNLSGVVNATFSGNVSGVNATFTGTTTLNTSLSGVAKAVSGVISASTIVNADISNSAAIAVSKIAAVTADRAIVSNGSGFISPATTTATEIGYVNGVTSAIQTQIDSKYEAARITNWGATAWTPTGTWTTAFNRATYTGTFRRVGDSIQARVNITVGSSGIADVGQLDINLPAGLTIDTTKIPGTSDSNHALGYGILFDESEDDFYDLTVCYNSTTTINVFHKETLASNVVISAFNNTNPVTIATDDVVTLFFELPIVEYA